MGERIALILEFSAELAYVLIGMIALFGGKLKKKWFVVIMYIGYVGLVCSTNVLFGKYTIDIFNFVGSSLAYANCFFTIYNAKTKKIRWLIARLLILTYIDELLYMFMNDILYLCGINIIEYKLEMLASLFSLSVILLITFIYTKYKDFFFSWKFTSHIRKSMIPMFTFFVFEIMCLTIWIDVLLEDVSELSRHMLGIGLSFLSMISIGIFVVMVLYVKKSNEKMEQLLVMEKQMQQYQRDYYETLLEKEVETRKYRHDMNSHLVCLNRLASDKDIDGVRDYIKEMNSFMEQIRQITFCTGIATFDVLLNHYCMRLTEDTKVVVKGECNCDIAVSDMEQCMIFSNLIKNAVEAVQYVKEIPKLLQICVEQGKEYIQITIINSVNEKRVFVDLDGKLQTTKGDKKNHGIGLQNVMDTIYRNEGKLNYYIKNHNFYCEVILPIKKLNDRMLG